MKKRYTSHIAHFILCILTGFIWLPIWVLCGLCNMRHNSKVDDWVIMESIKCGRVK